MELAIAESVVKNLAAMMIDKTSREIALVSNFTQDFNWLQQLTSIHVFLAEANSMARENDLVKIWLDRIRDVSWDAEDIIQECALRPLYVSNVTQSCASGPRELIFRYKMARRIHKLNERIRLITEDGEKLKHLLGLTASLSEHASGSGAARQENSCLPNDSHPVGIESKVEDLIRMIEKPDVRVITIVGIGGAGKTFLARNVFHRIKKRYQHTIWLSISQDYSIDLLQKYLLSKVGVENNSESSEEKADIIRQCLKDRMSVIVLDDVWSRGGESKIIERLGLPVGPDSQSKVVVTTRSEETCQKFAASLYKIKLLSEHESWQLFCAHAFQGDCPQHLDKIAREVVKKCGGLPLALKIIGASLYGFMEQGQWKSRSNQLDVVDLKEEIYPSSNEVKKILRLSYDFLSPALRLCFSYLSFFPKDEKIDPEYLINLWIAEGFIPFGEYQWEVALGYFYKLENLCLLEVKEDEDLVKHCKMHSLLRDTAIAISKENQCKFDGNDCLGSAKRIFLHEKKIQKMDSVQRRTCPRSLRALSLSETPIVEIKKKFISRIRSLRVLDLSKTNISTLPRCVRKLKVLKLLNLSQTRIKKVPRCVRSLTSLIFLDLSRCSELKGLPVWINRLKCLHHINIIGCGDKLLSHLPKGISELVALRVLRSTHLSLSVEENRFLSFKDFAKLTSLQELSIEVNHEMQLNSLQDETFSEPLAQMRVLSVKSNLSCAPVQPPDFSAMHYLQTLELKNFVVPSWIRGLTDLVNLSLVNCYCTNYPELHALPNLKRLSLDGNTSCENLAEVFEKPSGFSKLRFLSIQKFSMLTKLPDLDNGTLPVLEQFYVGDCRRVSSVPKGLECSTKLRKFYYTGDESDGLNKGQDFWDSIRARIRDTPSCQVKIIVSF